MINFKAFTTYKKISTLVVLFGLLFGLLFSGLFYFIYTSKQSYFEAGQNGFYKEISALLEMKDEPIKSTMKDLTYWDVLVEYFENPTQESFSDNVGFTVEGYSYEYVATYGLDGNLIHKSTAEDFNASFLSFPPDLLKRAYAERDLKFYQQGDEHISIIYLSTVHPTIDPQKINTNPSGFLVIVEEIDEEYYESISSVSGTTIRHNDIKNDNNDFFERAVTYKNHDGSIIDTITYTRPSFVDYSKTSVILVILLVVFILYVIIYLSIAKRWVKTPLEYIRNILKSNDQKALEKLENSSVDFKEIALLFKQAEKREIDLKTAKTKAEESDRLKSSFLANLSHEIRTPMNAILGFSELLEQDQVSESEHKEYLRIMHQSGSNLISIIDDLIEMSKIDVHQLTPNNTSFRIDETVAHVVHSLKITIPLTKSVILNLIAPIESIETNIISDNVKIKQILTNLISNALKFTSKGYVTVSYKINEEDQMLYFSVKDTGKGISTAEQEVIFDRFRQVEDDYTVESGGLGLGLSISKAYVEMLGGTIQLESVLGKGTTFTFSIPLVLDNTVNEVSEDTSINTEVKPEETIDLTQKLILIAEDDNINFMLINKLLTDLGCKTIRAVNGNEAVEICRANESIDLVIMDIKMPVKNGFEAREDIISFAPQLPMLAHTAFAAQEDKIKTKKAGFIGHIVKPLKRDLLLNSIQQVFINASAKNLKRHG